MARGFNNYGGAGNSYGPQAQQGYSYQGNGQRAPKKHSGAKKGTGRNGKSYVSGWNYSRRNGLVSFLAVPTKFSDEQLTSKSGKTYVKLMVVVNRPMAGKETTNGFLEIATGKVRIPDYGIVMNPNAPNGGYCGKSGKPSNNRR